MSNNCFCLRTTRCFCISNSSLLIMSSLSWMVTSLSPSSKRRCLNFSVEITMLSTAGPISSALDTRGNMSLTAFNASNHDALSSLLSALKCSLFFVPVYTENLLSSDLLSLIEHTLSIHAFTIIIIIIIIIKINQTYPTFLIAQSNTILTQSNKTLAKMLFPSLKFTYISFFIPNFTKFVSALNY